jgi:hypothetical protein
MPPENRTKDNIFIFPHLCGIFCTCASGVPVSKSTRRTGLQLRIDLGEEGGKISAFGQNCRQPVGILGYGNLILTFLPFFVH